MPKNADKNPTLKYSLNWSPPIKMNVSIFWQLKKIVGKLSSLWLALGYVEFDMIDNNSSTCEIARLLFGC